MNNHTENLVKLVRYYILLSTTSAGSGHVTSSLSAVELMTSLFFSFFKYDLDNPGNPNNDHLIFSKGHASPLFYALYAAAGRVTEKELRSFRKFDSVLEGHPSMRFSYTEAPTGSLGQGLSVGLGIALYHKYINISESKTFVLLGDGEMAEGQVWEALQLASHYKLNNLIGILDVNRLGQSEETMLSHDIQSYELRVKSFGWNTYLIHDGNNLEEVSKAYEYVLQESLPTDKPYMIIAKTIKGKGVSFLEDEEGWHGKALDKEQYKNALSELGRFDKNTGGAIKPPSESGISNTQLAQLSGQTSNVELTNYPLGEMVATREAYGNGLVNLGKQYSNILVLDGDVKNSTFTDKFEKEFPERFFQMYIAEQNMVSTAMGLGSRGAVPYVSTFAAFFTRAYDQLRMAGLSGQHIVFSGSHAGVSIGEDGPSQMGLQDIAMFRSELNSIVLYPSDAVATEKLVKEAYESKGIVYLRTHRGQVPVIYPKNEKFKVGGSKTLKISDEDRVTIIAAGVTLFEALKAADQLQKESIRVRVIDCYSIKPIDKRTLLKASQETKAIITVEDHYPSGGLGDAVLEVLSETGTSVYKMAVNLIPRSSDPHKLLAYENIDARSIVAKIKAVLELLP